MNLTHRNRVRKLLQVFAIIFRCGPPLSSGEGSLWLHLYGKLCKTDAHIKPSPLERGDRSGASLGEARAQTREAIVVDEMHPTDALSRLNNSEKAEAQRLLLGLILLLISQPHEAALFYLSPSHSAMNSPINSFMYCSRSLAMRPAVSVLIISVSKNSFS